MQLFKKAVSVLREHIINKKHIFVDSKSTKFQEQPFSDYSRTCIARYGTCGLEGAWLCYGEPTYFARDNQSYPTRVATLLLEVGHTNIKTNTLLIYRC